MLELFSNKDKYPFEDEKINLIIRCFIFGLLGLVFGLLINIFAKKILQLFNLSLLTKAVIQILFSTILLGFIAIYFMPNFSTTWQTQIPGLFFISIFFGSQYTMYKELQTYMDSITE